MVIKDLYSPEKKSPIQSVNPTLTPPGDRILAGVLDLLFHAPIFTLFSSIILYRLNLLKVTVSATSEKMAVVAQVIWIVAIGSVILQGIYLKLWKKTPGMHLLKLEIRSLRNAELTWGQCLLRSTVWFLEVVMMGIPLLEIFSHPKRYAIHDRISESEVVTLKTWGTVSPLPSEKATVHLIYTCMLMLTLGWMTALFSSTQKSIQDGSMAMAEWRDQNRLCSQVDEVSSYSDVDLTDVNTRIDFAISLFLLEQIDSDCFRKEVDFAVIKEVPGPLPWVGRTLLSAAYSKERQDYFAKACADDSHWCKKTLLQEKGTLAEAKEFLGEMPALNFENTSLAYNTAELILANRLGAADHASKLIELLQAKGVRATGLVSEHLKAVSRTNPERMPSVLQTLKSVMVEKDYLRLNSDLCLRQLESGCGSKTEECETMTSILPKYKDSLSDLVVSRALFKSALCKKDLAENMEYWTLISSDGLQKLIRLALQLDKEPTRSQGMAKIRNFIKDETQIIELRLDALQLLLSRSDFDGDWKLAPYLWTHLDWTQPSFLTASEWLMREGRKTGNQQLVLSLAETFSTLPGLKFDWDLLNEKSQRRVPASQEGKTR